jgi:hypothetical protein
LQRLSKKNFFQCLKKIILKRNFLLYGILFDFSQNIGYTEIAKQTSQKITAGKFFAPVFVSLNSVKARID